jgi:LacI family transcriptional regulator
MLGSGGLMPLSPVLRQAPVPVVHVVRRLEPQPQDSVFADDRSGAYQATSYLASLGHERIALIVGKRDTDAGNERRIGYMEALSDAGLAPDRSIIFEGAYRPETGSSAVRRLLRRNNMPTALFIANHEAAFGALPALAERGIEVPKELSVVVYEDAPWFSYWSPPLTVVDNEPVAIAETALRILLARLARGGDEPAARDEPAAAARAGSSTGAGTRAVVIAADGASAGHARLLVRSSCAGPSRAASATW